MRRALFPVSAVGLLVTLAFAASASPAAASVTIGQLAPTVGTGGCDSNADRVQATVSSGTSYVVPTTANVTSWTLSSWSTLAGTGSGQQMTLKVFRSSGGSNYTVVGHDGPRTLNSSTLNTFSASLQVKPGDILGLHTVTATIDCHFAAPGDIYLYHAGDLVDGSSGSFDTTLSVPDSRLNIEATLEPIASPVKKKCKHKKKHKSAAVVAKKCKKKHH